MSDTPDTAPLGEQLDAAWDAQDRETYDGLKDAELIGTINFLEKSVAAVLITIHNELTAALEADTGSRAAARKVVSLIDTLLEGAEDEL